MLIAISLVIIYILSFALIFLFIYTSNKKEDEAERGGLGIIMITSAILSLAPAVVIASFLFIVFGSANMVDILFSLDVQTNQLIIMSISLFIYLMTFDNLIDAIVKHILGENITKFIVMAFLRIFAFYFIGALISVGHDTNIMISTGVSVI